MGRFVSLAALGCILLSCAFLASCGHSQTTNVIVNPVPTSVSLTSSSAVGLNVSLEVGKTLGFTATARNPRNQAINETFSFLSSNPAVVTIAGNGGLSDPKARSIPSNTKGTLNARSSDAAGLVPRDAATSIAAHAAAVSGPSFKHGATKGSSCASSFTSHLSRRAACRSAETTSRASRQSARRHGRRHTAGPMDSVRFAGASESPS